MDSLSLEEKREQFHAFFTIQHALRVNMKCLGSDYALPPHDKIVDHMPYAFKIASEISSIEASALRPLRNLGEHAKELAEFLNFQSKKIDLMMSYILQQQDEQPHRYVTHEFGGGGLTLVSQDAVEVGEITEVKIFLTEESAGVFCFAEVIRCEPVDQQFHVSLIFSRIREQDQELLVRASLHVQTLKLRARAKQQEQTP